MPTAAATAAAAAGEGAAVHPGAGGEVSGRRFAPGDAFLARFSCLGDRATRYAICGKMVVVLLHVGMVGVTLPVLIDFRLKVWYIAVYLMLVLAALFQYFYTCYSSPGYVREAMRRRCKIYVPEKALHPDQSQSDVNNEQSSSALDTNSAWSREVAELYHTESAERHWTCHYCKIIQPPRSRHCPFCDTCVLQFDHHCGALGQCIGKGNHSKFWWFLFEESVLCIWTDILLITFLRSKGTVPWWTEFVIVVTLVILNICIVFVGSLLLFHSFLALTNQTTYEFLRWRRLFYFKELPGRVHPFSKGLCRNIFTFCCSFGATYTLEALPTTEDLEAAARPYTLLDVVACRCL